MISNLHDFSKLKWYKITLILECLTDRNIKYSTIQAILKGSYLKVEPNYEWQKNGGANIIFKVKDKYYDSLKRIGDKIIVDIFIVFKSHDFIIKFINAIKQQLLLKESKKYYSLIKVSYQKDSFYNYLQIYEKFLNKKEVVLYFYTPFAIKEKKSGKNTHISKEKFISRFLNRFKKIFNENFEYESEFDNFQILSYWNYVRHFTHNSRSQANTQMYLHGYVGKLYIKGRFNDFLPFLILGLAFNAGTKTSYGMGYYKLKEKEILFDISFPQKEKLLEIMQETNKNYDNLIDFGENKDFEKIIDSNKTIDIIYNKLTDLSYQFSPSKIFKIPKKNGDFRIIEEFNYTDTIVLKYINNILSDKLESVFEKESIGFRKGISRERGVKLIKEAISEGYEFIVESDIQEFFPSVNLDILKNMLDFYIPEEDIVFRQMLLKAIFIPFKENNEIKNREIGLPQGSPLSPLLANLYLHDFDQKIKRLNFKLIRYADDFIIMSRTFKGAQKALSLALHLLSRHKLNIKKEKTSIKHIDEGFTFLGINFKGIEVINNEDNLVKILKKPLYIIEPYIFLSLNGESINIIKNKKVIQNIPIRRISEIIILDKVVFSTSFIKKMTYFKIPITITLESGYHVTTINNTEKEHYKISMLHLKKYDNLSDIEKLLIAKEIAKNKIYNYLNLVKIKHIQSNKLLIENMETSINKINGAISLNEVRGYEGSIAKKIFANMNNLIIDDKFHIRVRKRKNNDPINSLLNFGYYLLFTRINATVRAIGLNPYLGFLHSPANKYESFVADMQESFRASVDRLIIQIVNLGVININDFVFTDKGTYLTYTGRKKFVLFYENEFAKKEKITDISLKEEIYFQILSFKKWILDKGNIRLYKSEDY